jgi:hypothetical protein
MLSYRENIIYLVKVGEQRQLTMLTSLSRIGQMTVLFLILIADGFPKFETTS